MAEMTPAQELRAAATRMRERATPVPQDWRLVRSQIIAVGTDRLAGSGVIATCMVPDRAAYVASMHPGVALAVADWLETVVRDLDGVFMEYSVGPALRVARAYLGSKGAGS